MKVALIGLGMVARTHLAALKDASGIELAGVLARTHKKTAEFAQEASEFLGATVRAYETVDDIAADAHLSFAIVATPPDARREIVAKLVAAQIPILMEKPIERTFENAREIVELCEKAGVPCGVVFQNRTRSAAQALKRAILEKSLGDIISADIRVPWWREQSYYDEPGRGTYQRDGGGVLISQAIHTIDLALWLLGPLKSVQALLRTTSLHQMEAEDWAGAIFETMAGATGTLMATTAAIPGGSESIRLSGTKAAAHLEAGVLKITSSDGSTETIGQAAMSGGGADPMAFTHAWHQRIIEDFARALATDTTPLASARSALRAQAVIDAMERSSASGRKAQVVPV